MSATTRYLGVDGIEGHSGSETQISEQQGEVYWFPNPTREYGTLPSDDPNYILNSSVFKGTQQAPSGGLNSVYYSTSLANTHLVWTRSITMQLDGGLCGVNIGQYVSDLTRNPYSATNVTLILAAGETVSDLQFKGIIPGWNIIFINHGTVIGEQAEPAITMYADGRAVIENKGKIKGGGGHGGKGEAAAPVNKDSGWLSYTSTTGRTVKSPYSNTYWLDYKIRGGGGAGARKGSAGSGYSDFDWDLFGGYQGSYKSGNFGTSGSVSMKLGGGGSTVQPTTGCAPEVGGSGGSSIIGSITAGGGKGGGWCWCNIRRGGPQGYGSDGWGLSGHSGFNNRSYYGQGSGAGSGGDGWAKSGANGSVSYKWHYRIPGGDGGDGGNGATRAGCDTNSNLSNVYEVQKRPGSAGSLVSGGTRGGRGGDGGDWGKDGEYGFSLSGSQSSSFSTGRTYGGPSIMDYTRYAKAGSFIGTVNVNYWGNPT